MYSVVIFMYLRETKLMRKVEYMSTIAEERM